MSRRSRPQYRLGLEWISGVAFPNTLTRPVRLAQGFTSVRCCGSPRASSPHGLTAPAPCLATRMLHAVASGSRLLPSRPAKDFHLQSSAHARHTWSGYALPTPRQNRSAPRSANPGRDPLKIRGELSKQAGPTLTATAFLHNCQTCAIVSDPALEEEHLPKGP